MNRRALLSLLAGAFVALVVGCLSPTLPLPPPGEPTSIQQGSAAGLWEIGGDCNPGAMVLIRNERTGLIAGVGDPTTNSGRYVIEISAEECDPATVFEIVDDDMTASTSFLVRVVINGVPQQDCTDAGL